MSDRGVRREKKDIFREWLKSIQQLSLKSSLSSLHIYIYIFMHIFFQLMESIWKLHWHCAAGTSLEHSEDQISCVSTTLFNSWSFFGKPTTPPFWMEHCIACFSHSLLDHLGCPHTNSSIWSSWAHLPKTVLLHPHALVSCVMPQLCHVGLVS